MTVPMSKADAKRIILGMTPDCSQVEILRAWQSLVDSGEVWQMGKWASNMASCMIDAGTLERNSAE